MPKTLQFIASSIVSAVKTTLVIGAGNKNADVDKTSGWSTTALYHTRNESMYFSIKDKDNKSTFIPSFMSAFTRDTKDPEQLAVNIATKAVLSSLSRAGNCNEQCCLGLLFFANLIQNSKDPSLSACTATLYGAPEEIDHNILILEDNNGHKMVCDPWIGIVCPIDTKKEFSDYKKFVIAVALFEINHEIEKLSVKIQAGESYLTAKLILLDKSLDILEAAYCLKHPKSSLFQTLFNNFTSIKDSVNKELENFIANYVSSEPDLEKRKMYAQELRLLLKKIQSSDYDFIQEFVMTQNIDTVVKKEYAYCTPENFIKLKDSALYKLTSREQDKAAFIEHQTAFEKIFKQISQGEDVAPHKKLDALRKLTRRKLDP